MLNLFRVSYPDEVLENSFGYVFFSKPDLYLLDGNTINNQIRSRPEFMTLIQTHPQLFANLQSSAGYGPFILPLCNKCTSFNPTDEVIKTRNSAETANDWKVVYAHRINDSRAANTIDLSFTDDRNLNVYNTIKIWINYMHLVTVGELSPKHEMVSTRTLDYAGAIYFFLTDETATNIIYYCKLIGAFPLNIPSSNFAWELGNFKKLEYTISFQYFKKDETPLVIRDFNKLGSGSNGSANLLNSAGGSRVTWYNGVYIENNNGKLQLKFN